MVGVVMSYVTLSRICSFSLWPNNSSYVFTTMETPPCTNLCNHFFIVKMLILVFNHLFQSDITHGSYHSLQEINHNTFFILEIIRTNLGTPCSSLNVGVFVWSSTLTSRRFRVSIENSDNLITMSMFCSLPNISMDVTSPRINLGKSNGVLHHIPIQFSIVKFVTFVAIPYVRFLNPRGSNLSSESQWYTILCLFYGSDLPH